MRGGALVLLWCCACPAREAAVVEVPRPAQEALAPDAGPAVTAASLDAWLRWQQALARLPTPGRGDGGAGALLGRARQEAALLAEVGLTSVAADAVEEIVAAVVAERSMARLTGADALAEFSASLAQLPPERRAKAEGALMELKERAAAASTTELEARFGAEVVRVVLTREAEVTKTWDTLLDARGD